MEAFGTVAPASRRLSRGHPALAGGGGAPPRQRSVRAGPVPSPEQVCAFADAEAVRGDEQAEVELVECEVVGHQVGRTGEFNGDGVARVAGADRTRQHDRVQATEAAAGQRECSAES